YQVTNANDGHAKRPSGSSLPRIRDLSTGQSPSAGPRRDTTKYVAGATSAGVASIRPSEPEPLADPLPQGRLPGEPHPLRDDHVVGPVVVAEPHHQLGGVGAEPALVVMEP